MSNQIASHLFHSMENTAENLPRSVSRVRELHCSSEIKCKCHMIWSKKKKKEGAFNILADQHPWLYIQTAFLPVCSPPTPHPNPGCYCCTLAQHHRFSTPALKHQLHSDPRPAAKGTPLGWATKNHNRKSSNCWNEWACPGAHGFYQPPSHSRMPSACCFPPTAGCRFDSLSPSSSQAGKICGCSWA